MSSDVLILFIRGVILIWEALVVLFVNVNKGELNKFAGNSMKYESHLGDTSFWDRILRDRKGTRSD